MPKFSNLCLANAIEPLRAANQLSGRPLYAWRFASFDGTPVTSSSGIAIGVDTDLGALAEVDILFVVASYDYRAQVTGPTLARLRRAARRASMMAGLDTGSFFLARAGLLDGYRATIHWQELAAFEEEFLAVTASNERFVIDRNRVTAGGATTALDLMLHLIGTAHGDALRLDVAGLFIYDALHRPGDPQRAAPPPDIAVSARGGGRDPLVLSAMHMMEREVEQRIAIEHIAAALGVSQRALERRFRAALGLSPVACYQHVRLSAARRLVAETALPLAEIAVRSGFSSASALARAFRQHFGTAPSTLRRAPLR